MLLLLSIPMGCAHSCWQQPQRRQGQLHLAQAAPVAAGPAVRPAIAQLLLLLLVCVSLRVACCRCCCSRSRVTQVCCVPEADRQLIWAQAPRVVVQPLVDAVPP